MLQPKNITEPLNGSRVLDECNGTGAADIDARFLSDSDREDSKHECIDESKQLFYKYQSQKHRKLYAKNDKELAEIINQSIMSDTKEGFKNLVTEMKKIEKQRRVNDGHKTDSKEPVPAQPQNNDDLKIHWAKQDKTQFCFEKTLDDIANFQNKGQKYGIMQLLMDKRREYMKGLFGEPEFDIPEVDKFDKKIKQTVHEFLFWKEKAYQVTKTIETLNNDEDFNQKLRLRLFEFDTLKPENQGKPLFDETLAIGSPENKYLVDAVSKTFIQVKNEIYFYVISQTDQTQYQRKMYDLETKKLTKFNEIKEHDNDQEKLPIVGIIFANTFNDRSKQESHQNLECSKCFNHHQQKTKREDIIQDIWICIATEKGHSSIQMAIRSFEEENYVHSDAVFSYDKALEPKTFGVGLGYWNVEDKKNGINGYLILSKRENNNNPDKSCELDQLFTLQIKNKNYEKEKEDLDEAIDEIQQKGSLNSQLSILNLQKQVQSTLTYQVSKTYKDKNKERYINLLDKAMQYKQLKEQQSDQNNLSVKISKSKTQKIVEEVIQRGRMKLVKISSWGDLNIHGLISHFYKFYQNQHHKIYRIDKVFSATNSKDKNYVNSEIVQEHNKHIERALIELVPGKHEKMSLMKQNYSILNFKEQNESIIVMVLLDNRTVYLKSKSKHIINSEIRHATQWNDKNNEDGLALSYYDNNKGFLQVHPAFSNVFVNCLKKIQVGNQVFKYDLNDGWTKITDLLGINRNANTMIIQQNVFQDFVKKKCPQEHIMDHYTRFKDKVKSSKLRCSAENKCKQKDGDKGGLFIGEDLKSYFHCSSCYSNNYYYHDECAPNAVKESGYRSFKTKVLENELQEKSRRIQFAFDDRKVFPRLKFDKDSSQIKIEVVLDKWQLQEHGSNLENKVLRIQNKGEDDQIEIVDVSKDITNAPQNTVLSASSVVESKGNYRYQQKFQVAIMDISGMWVKIKEYLIEWINCDECLICDNEKGVKMYFVGMKLLLLRRPIDKSQKKKTLNFLPYTPDGDYIIQGTQIIPVAGVESENDHIQMKNFENDDFQFKSDLFASGYKIYVEDGNFSKQKYLLFESQYLKEIWEKEKRGEPPKFDNMDINLLLERQILVMMNMVPIQDAISGDEIFIEKHVDFLAPLEILQGNSLCDYELNNMIFIRNRQVEGTKYINDLIGNELSSLILQKGDDFEASKKVFSKSIIENFLLKYNCECGKAEKISSLINSFPRDQGWKRDIYEVSGDLHFQNPIMRGINDQIWDFQVADLKKIKTRMIMNRIYDQIQDFGEANIEIKLRMNVEIQERYLDKQQKKQLPEEEERWKKHHTITFIGARELVEKFMLNRTNSIRSYQSYQILQSVMNEVMSKDDRENNDMSAFKKYYFDEISNDQMTENNLYSFARFLDDPNLPQDMIGAPRLQKFNHDNIPVSDRKTLVEKYIVDDKKHLNNILPDDENKDDEKLEAIGNYIIDFKPIVIQQKLRRYFDDQLKPVENSGKDEKKKFGDMKRDVFDEYSLALLITKINDNFQDEIDKQGCIKSIIDFQFQKRTRFFFRFQFFFYLFFCLIPFMCDILISEDTHDQRIIFDVVFGIAVFCLTYNEYVQFKIIRMKSDEDEGLWKKFKEYQEDMWNKVDLAQLILFWINLFIRLFVVRSWIPDSNIQPFLNLDTKYGVEEWQLILMMILNISVFTSFFLKCLQFMQVFDAFGNLSELIIGIAYNGKMSAFILFFFINLIFFTLIFLILGGSFGETALMKPEWNLFVNIFEMVCAVINNPIYDFWEKYNAANPNSPLAFFYAHLIVACIWTVWFIFQITISVILLNFLIALISQAYEEVMNKSQINMYRHKAKLNKECYLMYSYWDKLVEVDCFILQSLKNPEGEKDWAGFSRTMAQTLSKENSNLLSSIKTQMNNQYELYLKGQNNLKKEHKKQIQNLERNIQQKLEAKKHIKKINDKLADKFLQLFSKPKETVPIDEDKQE